MAGHQRVRIGSEGTVEQLELRLEDFDNQVQSLIQAPIESRLREEQIRRRREVGKVFNKIRLQAGQQMARALTDVDAKADGGKPSMKDLSERAKVFEVSLAQVMREIDSAEKNARATIYRLNYADAGSDREVRGQIRARGGSIATGGRQRLIKAKDRQWQVPARIAELVEMAAKTEHSLAFLQGCRRDGHDLVRVSDHAGGRDDECGEWAGKIYSISGKSNKYPKLLVWPPFHVHCWHVLERYLGS